MIWLTVRTAESGIAHSWGFPSLRARCGVPGEHGSELCARRCLRCERSVNRHLGVRGRRRTRARPTSDPRVLPGQLSLALEST